MPLRSALADGDCFDEAWLQQPVGAANAHRRARTHAPFARSTIRGDEAAILSELAEPRVRPAAREGRASADHPVWTGIEAPVSGRMGIDSLRSTAPRQCQHEKPSWDSHPPHVFFGNAIRSLSDADVATLAVSAWNPSPHWARWRACSH